MKRMIVAALMALFVLTPAGWAGGYYYSAPITLWHSQLGETQVGSYANIHKVAVLSCLGSQFTLWHWNFWKPRTENLDISAWKIDGEIEETFHNYLGSRFEFVPMSFDPTAVMSASDWLMRQSSTIDALKKLNNPGVDAYILVRPDKTFAVTQGLSLTYNPRETYNSLSVDFEIDVIDAHTLTYISHTIGRVATPQGVTEPDFEITNDFWRGFDEGPLSEERIEALHGFVRKIMTQAMLETIRSLQFDVPLPASDPYFVPIMPPYAR